MQYATSPIIEKLRAARARAYGTQAGQPPLNNGSARRRLDFNS